MISVGSARAGNAVGCILEERIAVVRCFDCFTAVSFRN